MHRFSVCCWIRLLFLYSIYTLSTRICGIVYVYVLYICICFVRMLLLFIKKMCTVTTTNPKHPHHPLPQQKNPTSTIYESIYVLYIHNKYVASANRFRIMVRMALIICIHNTIDTHWSDYSQDDNKDDIHTFIIQHNIYILPYIIYKSYIWN